MKIICLSNIGIEVMKIIDPKPRVNKLYIEKIIEHIQGNGYAVRLVNNADFNNEASSLLGILMS